MSSSKTASKAERRRRIFLAARTIFVGANAQIRDRKDVKAAIERHQETFGQINSKKDLNVDVIWNLSEKGVFGSELKAKLEFPELYQVSAVRSLQHDVSEQNAARSEAEAFENISHAGSDDYQDGLDAHTADDPIVEDAPRKPILDLPSLYPTYFTYEVQHKLLNTVQSLLEQCCYDWAKRWIPALLDEKNWTCAEAVELGKWAEVLPRRFNQVGSHATSLDSGGSLKSALIATHQLRHAAVHRLPTSAKGIDKMLHSAVYLAKVLHDTSYIFKLEAVLKQFQSKAQDMELHKNQLENGLDDELKEIQEQRAALNKREKEAKANMVKQDKENTRELSWLFARSLRDLTIADDVGNVDEITAKMKGKELEDREENHSSNAASEHNYEETPKVADPGDNAEKEMSDQLHISSEAERSMTSAGEQPNHGVAEVLQCPQLHLPQRPSMESL